MSARDVLQAAKALLLVNGGKRRWTKGAMARNENLDPVDPRSPEASCWCVMGAVSACTDDYEIAVSAWGFLHDAAGTDMPLFAWQDAPDTSRSKMLATFDRAIAAAGGREGEA